jgi:histidine kinase
VRDQPAVAALQKRQDKETSAMRPRPFSLRLADLAQALPRLLRTIRCSLITKLAIVSGAALMFFFFLWSSLNINAMKTLATEATMSNMDRLGNTVNLGLHYAMLTYAPDTIREIIKSIGTQQGIISIRVYNKKGQIKYSNMLSEIDEITDIKEEACYVCHRTAPPQVHLALRERTRFFTDASGHPCIGILRPIENEPSCVNDPCHVHPADKKILGLLDITVSQAANEATLARYTEHNFLAALGVTGGTFLVLFLCTHILVNRPVRTMIRATRAIAAGRAFRGVTIRQSDELGELGRAIDTMGREVLSKQAELVRQKNRYQDLFEHVPCTITVQDKNLRLISYNQAFADEFHVHPGQYCYKAYKGREEPCTNCPVIRTFEDGLPHATEEITLDRDGCKRTFFVSTSPMTDESGKVTSVMEISLDISESKFLEEELERSRMKYQAIFSCIPTALFVLSLDDLTILECNSRPQACTATHRASCWARRFWPCSTNPALTASRRPSGPSVPSTGCATAAKTASIFSPPYASPPPPFPAARSIWPRSPTSPTAWKPNSSSSRPARWRPWVKCPPAWPTNSTSP